MTRLAIAVTLLAGFTAAVSGQTPVIAPSAVWNALGNTGSVDEADVSIHLFNATGSVSIRSTVRRATLDVRYNIGSLAWRQPVPPQDGEEEEGFGHCVALRAMVRDTGPGARVIVKLQAFDVLGYDLSPPVGVPDPDRPKLRTIGFIDSEYSAQGVPRQMASPNYSLITECLDVPRDFNFQEGQWAYFIEAQLVKTRATANPGLQAVGICNRTVMCEGN